MKLNLPLSVGRSETRIPIKDATGKTIAYSAFKNGDDVVASSIVRACNAYDELLAALKWALPFAIDAVTRSDGTVDSIAVRDRIVNARAAIAKAEEEV